MARIFIDGFESGGDDLWDAESNANVISSAGLDMDGDYCLDLNAGTEYIGKNITLDDEMYFAFLYRPTAAQSVGILSFYNGSTLLFQFTRYSVGNIIRAKRGTTTIDSGTAALNPNVTYLIEIRLKIANAGGRAVVKVNGITDIDFTGDTQDGTDTQFDKVRIGQPSTSGYTSYAYFDNFIMDDYIWIGDTKIQKILPTGAGNSTNWTPSAGANWVCVDERPASDVDYVSINANDIVDTYAAANMAGTIDNVKCVQIQSRTESEGAPTPNNLKLVVRSGAADHLSANKVVPTAPKGLYSLWETNPADSLAWEEADVNAMEIGIKSAA